MHGARSAAAPINAGQGVAVYISLQWSADCTSVYLADAITQLLYISLAVVQLNILLLQSELGAHGLRGTFIPPSGTPAPLNTFRGVCT